MLRGRGTEWPWSDCRISFNNKGRLTWTALSHQRPKPEMLSQENNIDMRSVPLIGGFGKIDGYAPGHVTRRPPLHSAPGPAHIVDLADPWLKSLTNRALPLAAMAAGTSSLSGVLHSDDTRHMINALRQWGITVEVNGNTISVSGQSSEQGLQASPDPLFVGNSGTTVRFLSAMAAWFAGSTRLNGDEDMAKRPISDLTEALASLGVDSDCASGCPPLEVHGGKGIAGSVSIPGNKSSQYISALLMAGAVGSSGITINISGSLVSEPYVQMTLRMIEAFGGITEVDGSRYRSQGPLTGAKVAIEPDASAASYAFAAAVATQGTVTVPHLGKDSLQGDVAFVEILGKMGATVEYLAEGIRVSAGNNLRGIEVDMHHVSDTVMTLAALAPLANGPTTITNVANIRIKETDRLIATVNELRRLGQGVEHGDDWLKITPASISPATIECYRDHRMAMSFAILGLARSGISIADPACVAKTYPTFWQHVADLYKTHQQECPWVNCA